MHRIFGTGVESFSPSAFTQNFWNLGSSVLLPVGEKTGQELEVFDLNKAVTSLEAVLERGEGAHGAWCRGGSLASAAVRVAQVRSAWWCPRGKGWSPPAGCSCRAASSPASGGDSLRGLPPPSRVSGNAHSTALWLLCPSSLKRWARGLASGCWQHFPAAPLGLLLTLPGRVLSGGTWLKAQQGAGSSLVTVQ